MEDSLFNEYDFEKSVQDLKKSMDILNELINEQTEHIDTIENMIDATKEETTIGKNEITYANEANEANNTYISYIIGGLSIIVMFFINS